MGSSQNELKCVLTCGGRLSIAVADTWDKHKKRKALF